jgi:E1A-binding protein p400
MILDEAHQIKNFESKRWQTLLGFQSRRRLLLTGTPLQNNLMELWSLMHFLMPKIFQSHAQFKEWFGAPVAEMVEGRSTKTKEQQMRDQERVHRLHTLLRPFLLRRLKKDVETQLPGKTEHVIKCSLSKRQRQLYDDFMSRSNTKASLRGGNYLTVVNVLMQLRKVCNHPNLFQEPVVQSPFLLEPLQCTFPALVLSAFENDPLTGVRDARRANPDTLSLALHNLCFLHHELNGGQKPDEGAAAAVAPLITALPLPVGGEQSGDFFGAATAADPASVHPLVAAVLAHKEQAQRAVLERHAQVNVQRSSAGALFGQRLLDMLTIYQEPQYTDMHDHFDIFDLIVDFETRTQEMAPLIARFSVFVPTVTSSFVEPWFAGNRFRLSDRTIQREIDTVRGLALTEQHSTQRRTLLHTALDAPRFQFPDRRLIQYDCGKLQTLERLLREKRVGAHRVLVFTQMSKMLDILEQFLNYHAFTYLRLDGSTPITERQRLMDRFNMDKRIFVFILSTRSGGVGVNLTGADTVVFYDSDWNPTMDAQVASPPFSLSCVSQRRRFYWIIFVLRL